MKTHLFTFNQPIAFFLLNRCWPRIILSLLLLSYQLPVAVGQTKLWDKTIGHSGDDRLSAIVATTDGGYLLGGTYGDGDYYIYGDYWIVKLNADGSEAWGKTIGGGARDRLTSLQQTSDGGYILGGTSYSNKSGDKTEDNKGFVDYWIVKLNADGSKAWDKTIGGSDEDSLASLQQTSDGGYILGGTSYSEKSGDKTQDMKGEGDYWVVKLNADGSKVWDRTLGSNTNDEFRMLQQTSDGGYLLGGSSASGKGGDKSEASKGATDYWIIKLNSNGSKAWDKTIGGESSDDLQALQQTSDGGYILGGTSQSGKSGDKTEDNNGVNWSCHPWGYCPDYWVVKLNADGTKAWDKTIGGENREGLASILQTSDDGYILGGTSDSGISGDKTEEHKRNSSDYWIVKLKADGSKAWDKTFGGDYEDHSASLQETIDRGYIVGGSSQSNRSGDKTEDNKDGDPF